MRGPIKTGTIASASEAPDNTIRTAIDADAIPEWTGSRWEIKVDATSKKEEMPLIKS